MSDSLEAELDRLFQEPLVGWVEARAALADRLRKAGDKVTAARVKGLRRPTPAAWLLNQIWLAEPALILRAREASDEVRALHAQDGVDPRALSATLASQRAILHEVVEAALKRSEAAGLPSGPGQQRKLLASLQGVLSGVSEEAFGRLTRDVEPGGFDAIAIVGSAASPVPHQPRPAMATPAMIKAAPAPATERLAEARALLRERELSAHEAHKRVQEAREETNRAAREQASAEVRVREAEESLVGLRARLAAREAELARVQAALEQALQVEAEARDKLATARRELEG